jgi:DtxR family Mn-dependent transcriptional regulator
MASEQVENYLKNIYKLQEARRKVSTSLLSERLQISAASVTEMVKKLSETGHLKYTPYQGVELTDHGRRKALRIIRRHRLWELFLVEVLKYRWDEIDEEAERLEHITSEKLEKRLDAMLGYPTKDPHGDAIPSFDGKVVDVRRTSLASVKPGKVVLVSRVSDASPEILQYATKLGLTLGRKIKVRERVEFDGSLQVDVGGKERFISGKLAENIFVDVG